MARLPKDLLDLLQSYNPAIQELAISLRDVVLHELAPCCEYILEVYVISLLYGPTHTPKDAVCYIAVMKDHINLGFPHGSGMRDPHHLLQGTGKQMRHIKLRRLEDLHHPAIRAYLQEASEIAGHNPAGAKKTVTTVVKRKAAKKKSIGLSAV